MSTCFDPKSKWNHWLRVLCAYAISLFPLIAGMSCGGGGGGGGGSATDAGDLASDQTSIDQAGTDQTDGSADASTPDVTDTSEPPGGLGGLIGWWVVENVDTTGRSVWGQAQGWGTLEDDEIVNLTFEIWLDDSTQTHNLDVTDYNSTSFTLESWYGDLDCDAGCTGEESDDRNTLTVELNNGDTLSFFRATEIDYSHTGVWERDSDGNRDAVWETEGDDLVVAYDEATESIVMSAPDATGDVDVDRHFLGWRMQSSVYEAEEGIELRLTGDIGWGATSMTFDALLFDDGTRIHIRVFGSGQSSSVLAERLAEVDQSELNGRWVFGARPGPGRVVQRGVAVLVANGDDLYVNYLTETATTLEPLYHATTSDGELYVDDDELWSGRVTADGRRIVGEHTDEQGSYESLDRTIQPEDGSLSGAVTSISLDWFSSGISDPVPIYGEGTITYEGGDLSITDTSELGTYVVEATWMGDHFEGSWALEAAPDDTSPWRGELLGNGWYLHGTWEDGEYSFSLLTLASGDSLGEVPDEQTAFIADPYDDTAATVSVDSEGIAASLLHNQGVVTGLSVASATDSLMMEVDERLRLTTVQTLSETITFTWADDATSVQISHDDGTTVTDETIAVDLSDTAMLATITQLELDTGRDLSEWQDWIEANPGLVLRVFSGEDEAPTLGDDFDLFQDPSEKDLTPHQKKVKDIVFLVLAGAAVVVSGAMVIAATPVTLGLVAGYFMAVATFAILLGFFMLEYGICPDCTLACFWNCLW